MLEIVLQPPHQLQKPRREPLVPLIRLQNRRDQPHRLLHRLHIVPMFFLAATPTHFL